MLFYILLIRLFPALLLKFCKKRNVLKLASVGFLLICLVLFFIAAGEILGQKGFSGIFYLAAAMFPHALFYLFALWMLLRCIWKEWSQRVWRRIYALSIVCVVCGAVTEAYLNPLIMKFFDLHNNILWRLYRESRNVVESVKFLGFLRFFPKNKD